MYDDQCAACGVGLDIVEAAHIVQHALSGDDAIENGLCLCPNHHTAFDLIDLIAFSEDRKIWINQARLDALGPDRDETAGRLIVLSYLRPTLATVPVDQSSRLRRRFLQQTEETTGWVLQTAMRL